MKYKINDSCKKKDDCINNIIKNKSLNIKKHSQNLSYKEKEDILNSVMKEVNPSYAGAPYRYTRSYKEKEDFINLTLINSLGGNTLKGVINSKYLAVEGATCTLTINSNDYSAVSDANGAFEITDIPAGTGGILNVYDANGNDTGRVLDITITDSSDTDIATVHNSYNINIPNFKAALNALKQGGTGKLSIVQFGDSICEGAFASPSRDTHGHVGIMRTLFADQFEDVGMGVQGTVRWDGSFWSKTGSWQDDDRLGLMGGCIKTNTLDDYAEWNFYGDSCKFMLMGSSITGQVAYSVDGGAETIVEPNGVGGSGGICENVYEITGLGAGSHTLKLRCAENSWMYIAGAWETKGTTGVIVHNNADSAKRVYHSQNQTLAGTHMLDAQIRGLEADLVILNFITNDAIGAGTAPATYKQQLQNIIDRAVAHGAEVIMVTAGAWTGYGYDRYDDYIIAMYELCDENNIGMIDIYNEWYRSYEWADAKGYMADYVHLTTTGQGVVGYRLHDVINE